MCEALDGLQIRGERIILLSLIKAKVDKNKSLDTIADELESTVDNIKPLYDAVLACGTDKDTEEIYKHYLKMTEQQ